MSKSSNFSEALNTVAARINQHLTRTTVGGLYTNLLNKEERVREIINTELDAFFLILARQIGGNTGPIGTKWWDLSDKWKRAKGSGSDNRFYVGKTGSFQSYLNSLSGAGHAQRIFGAPIIKIENFGTPGKLKQEQTGIEKVLINKTGKLNFMGTHADGKFGFVSPYINGDGRTPYHLKLNVRMDLTIFPILDGIENYEWDVVDTIIKKSADGSQENEWKQWVKINGRRGAGKNYNIRPLVLPLVISMTKARIIKALKETSA